MLRALFLSLIGIPRHGFWSSERYCSYHPFSILIRCITTRLYPMKSSSIMFAVQQEPKCSRYPVHWVIFLWFRSWGPWHRGQTLDRIIRSIIRAQVEGGPWAKYLQIRFLSQYGSEPVCAVNDIVVHGKSAAQDLEDQLAAGDDAASHLPPPAADDRPAAEPAAAALPLVASGGAVTEEAAPQEAAGGGGGGGDGCAPEAGAPVGEAGAKAGAPEANSSGSAVPPLQTLGAVVSDASSGGTASLGSAAVGETPVLSQGENASGAQPASAAEGTSGAAAGAETNGVVVQPAPTAAPALTAAAAAGAAAAGAEGCVLIHKGIQAYTNRAVYLVPARRATIYVQPLLNEVKRSCHQCLDRKREGAACRARAGYTRWCPLT